MISSRAPTIQMKSNLWNNWARIAILHEQEAARERARLVEVWGARGAARNIQPEMHASMVALVAVAFALDALHADVAPVIDRDPDPRTGRGKAWGYQFDTFRLALPGVANSWQADIEWLANVRRLLVHPNPVLHTPRPHPVLPTNVAVENLIFSPESATRAVDFLLLVLRAFFVGGRGDERIVGWGNDRGHVIAELDAIRAKVHAGQATSRAIDEP